ncbi:simple sugar transport system permease protein [Streptoalloteichus tenebrarius]|uniref:Xylose transport system permease protein XylH n=1 Tax=Streptoalloteichus tenebrarius (strain ATCC 17920 / DSM 40477 / JCM 4838 / CBS 697.72 / NBRC 16177 / NCIMB 11028 / NRRL B-12390 / A12253. 1 / ISP 5477) TaxID=1933 RepID=A0ABT1HV12_STRSD|nr:ABC transporter permease [Streptoalloteichus tenebrarius]MCP2259361.1 simple sugar transport system permease protein [Streptoalloteichus tenebrarius]BFF02301.1 ABC transporter permease [Streptoalloteichus tenebrarius]
MAVVAHTVDERLARTRPLDRLLVRPELGSLLGALAVFAFFSVVTDQFLSAGGVSTWLDDSATLGIMAVAVALLMVGGEFDLSAGVMTASTGLVTAILATQLNWNVWWALLASLVFALVVGALNGWLVMRTGLPSFIVTLGTFLALQGLNLGVTKLVTGTVQVSGMRSTEGYASAGFVFASTVNVGGATFQVSVLWWLGFTAVATWLLLRTRLGNWIFAVGGAATSARQVGVPVVRTKVLLFMTTAAAAWLVGGINVLRYTSVQANQGIGQEFFYIIAAVIGGCLLTGGFGSAVGAAVGALIFGMTRQGIVFAGWNNDWFMLFLGVMLLAAVLVNNAFRRRAERVRR